MPPVRCSDIPDCSSPTARSSRRRLASIRRAPSPRSPSTLRRAWWVGSNRRMPSTPDLKLDLIDANGELLDEPALVTFLNLMTGTVKSARSQAGKTLNVRGLDRGSTGLY